MHAFGELPLGMVGLYIAAVLVVNLLVMMGKGNAKNAAILNLLTGFLSTMLALWSWIIGGSPFTAAQTLLFGFTYIWIGVAYWNGETDFRAFGWYCLFVTINAIPFAYYSFALGLPLLGFNWILWGLAWFMFFLVMGIQKANMFKPMLAVSWFATIVLWICSLGWLIGWFDFAGFLAFP